MKKKTFLFSFGLLLVLLLALTGCAPDREQPSNGSGSTDEGAAGKPEELTIWANDEEEQLQAIEEIAAKYEEKEGIKVNVVAKSMLEQIDELALAGPEGKGPDLFIQPHDRIGDIVAQGLAQPLEIEESTQESYSQVSLDAVTYEYDGKTDLYGVPAVIETYGIFYNKDIITEKPSTIDDLKAAIKQHTDPSQDEYGFLMKPNDFYFTYPFFKNFGAYIFGGDVGEYDISDVGLANEGAIKGGELYQSFFGKGMIPASTTTDVIDGLFTEGKVGAVINGPWSIPSYREALGDKVGFVPFPEINGSPATTLVGVKSWMVSYFSENKEWATDLALFITDEANQQTYFEVAGELPTNTSALQSIEDPIYAAFSEQIEHGVPMPSTPQMSQVWEPMNNALQFLVEGEDPEAVLTEAVEYIHSNIEASGGAQ
ncbi:sugar ABC transporter substrate-binding protein [Paraliobacillus ryukyuensis]|uniref:sugar ABC transporter substrate-binding protein n=1 Tax=Paraliobacillus ryukyuensis TaxID=200904 RepID=UPI0009A8F8D0|nr:extracellular solute-binding protein [Paraliobacillus ryukyuensis]